MLADAFVCLTTCVPKSYSDGILTGSHWLWILSFVYGSISSVLGGHRAVLANVTLCVSRDPKGLSCFSFPLFIIFLCIKASAFQETTVEAAIKCGRDKIPSFFRQNLKGWMSVCVCVYAKGRGIPQFWSADICCRPLQSWNLILSFTQRALTLAANARSPLYTPLHGGNTHMERVSVPHTCFFSLPTH